MQHRIAWTGDTPSSALEILLSLPIANYAPSALLGMPACRKLAKAILDEGGREIGQLLGAFLVEQRGQAFRTVFWLAKFGLVEIEPPASPKV